MKTLLEQYINQMGISKYRFAKDSGIQEDSLYKYLRRDAIPTIRTFHQLCCYLKSKRVKFSEKELMLDLLGEM